MAFGILAGTGISVLKPAEGIIYLLRIFSYHRGLNFLGFLIAITDFTNLLSPHDIGGIQIKGKSGSFIESF